MRYGALLASLVLLAAACSRANGVANVAEPKQNAANSPARSGKAAPERQAMVERKVGDFWVHRISGSFVDQAMLLTERVVGKTERDITIEYALESAEGTTKLRVRHSLATDEVLEVERLVDGRAVPGTLADYEALVAKTAVVPDSNEGLLAAQRSTCLVGPYELDCETKTYRVTIGDKKATLDITHSEIYPGRDVAGEISAESGELLYRAELLESGSEKSADDSVAARRGSY